MYYVKPYLVKQGGTFSRASTATYTDAAGVLRYAAIDEQRPIIETIAATNLVPTSQELTAVTGVVVATGYAGPDATTSATRIRANISETSIKESIGASTAALTSGATYGASVYLYSTDTFAGVRAKLSGGTTYGCVVNLATGAVVASSGAANITTEDLTGGWWRIGFAFVAGAAQTAAVQLRFALSSSVDSSWSTGLYKDVYFFGAQIEAGSVSSYIPTTGAAATRAVDIVTAGSGGSELQYSNVAVTEAAWLVGTAYVIGDKVIVGSGTDIYEAVANNTGVNPTTDTTGKWLNIGKVNRWKMFDGYMSTGTSNLDEISVSIRPSAAVDCLALFGVVGYKATVIVIDDTEGEVYRNVTYLRGTTPTESSWTAARRTLPVSDDIMLLSDLPLTKTCTITIQIAENTGSNAECGMCIVGRAKQLGSAKWGVKAGIADYSAKTVDTFGNVSITERAYADRADYQIMLLDGDEYTTKKELAAVRATPCVYVGDAAKKTTVVYGYYKSFDCVLSHANWSDWNLEVEGLT